MGNTYLVNIAGLPYGRPAPTLKAAHERLKQHPDINGDSVSSLRTMRRHLGGDERRDFVFSAQTALGKSLVVSVTKFPPLKFIDNE